MEIFLVSGVKNKSGFNGGVYTEPVVAFYCRQKAVDFTKKSKEPSRIKKIELK